MLFGGRPQRVRKPSGSRSSHGFFTPEERYSKYDYIGAFADGLAQERNFEGTRDDFCLNLSRQPFKKRRMATDDYGSMRRRSPSSSGGSEGQLHSSIEREFPGDLCSPINDLKHDKTVSYPTPQPISKPHTPISNFKMQRFPSLPSVEVPNLPPTPESLQSTPIFGSGLDMGMRKRVPSPEIPSDEETESEGSISRDVEPDDCEDQSKDIDDVWEDIEEDTEWEDEEADELDDENYETATDEDGLEVSGGGSEDFYMDKSLHLEEVLTSDDDNMGESWVAEEACTPKLRAKLEASPQLSPLLDSTTPPSHPSSPTLHTSLITPQALHPSSQAPPHINRVFNLTSHSSCSSSDISVSRSSDLSLEHSSAIPVACPPSSSELHSLDSAIGYPSGLSVHRLTTFPLDHSAKLLAGHSADSSVLHTLRPSIGSNPYIRRSSNSSVDHPSDLSDTRSSEFCLDRSSDSSVDASPDFSVQRPSTLPIDIISRSHIKHSLEMPPFLRIRKTADGMVLSTSTERLLPIKSKESSYEARSSIPSSIPLSQYADECIAAAEGSRLSPYQLHTEELKLMINDLSHTHVTTYLNIRNGILRLWLSNPKVWVSKAAAAGCCKDSRFFGLAEVAHDWLTRRGYINHGCLRTPKQSSTKKRATRRRKTIAVIGAGISGLATARQLDTLLATYGECLGGSEAPDVVVFEGRHRLGGRVYSAALADGSHNLPDGLEPAVDMGGQIVMGYEGRNPLAALIQQQLAIPFNFVDMSDLPMYDHDGKLVEDKRVEAIDLVHNDILNRIATFRHKDALVTTAVGDIDKVRKCKDPWSGGGVFLAEAPQKLVQVSSDTITHDLPLLKEVRQQDGKRKADAVPANHKPAKRPKMTKESLEALEIEVKKATNEDGLASLGLTMDGVFPGYADLLEPDARDLRLYNWYHANLEYGNAAALHRSSLEHWDQDDGNEPWGAHSMIVGGYGQLAEGLSSTPSRLDVRFDHEVTRIKYDPDNKEKGVTLKFADNSEFTADKVIVTLPLGVLKLNNVQFDPPLPATKRSAIDRLGFGLLNKVIMVYDEAFWDTTKDAFGCLRKPEEGADEALLSSYEKKRGRFYIWWNVTAVVGRPTLVGLMVGDAAEQVEHEEESEVMKEATSILKKCWGEDKVPDEPKECMVTKWRRDRFALGSYSYIAAGSTGADYDTIAEPIDNTIFFAGEHTIRQFPATVHGAYLSGLRVANEVANSVLGPIDIPKPLIQPRNLKSSVETVVEISKTTRSRMNPFEVQKTTSRQVQATKSVKGQTTKGTKFKNVQTTLQTTTTTTVSGRKTKRKAADEPEREVPAKKRIRGSNTQPAASETTKAKTVKGIKAKVSRETSGLVAQKKAKRKATEDPEIEVPPEKKPRTNSSLPEQEQNAVSADPRPEEPKKDTGNPFLIYQKDFFKTAQNRANQNKRQETGAPDAKADRNEVRIVLGEMWRTSSEDLQRGYRDQADQNKRNNLTKMNDYKRQLDQWEKRQTTNATSDIPVLSSQSSSLPSSVPSESADPTPSVDNESTDLSALIS